MFGSPGWEHFGTAGLAQRGFHKDIGGHARGVGIPLQTSSSVAAGANLDDSDEEEMIGDSPVRGVPLKGCIRGRSLERCQGSLVDANLRRSRSVSSVAFRDPSTPVQTFSFQDRNRCGGPDLAGRGPVPSRQGEVRRVPSAALSVPPRDPAAASTRGSGVTPLAPTSSRYRWQALPAAKELQSQRTGRYGRVQPAPPPGVSKSFKCTVVDTGLGKTRDDLLHTSVDSVVLDYDEESPEEGEVRDPERGVPSHVSSSVLQAPVVQSQVQGRREHGPSSRAPRRPDALTSETRAEPSRVVSLLPGSVAGPRSSVLTVWIVGHSFVKWARVQAARSYFGDLLGFNDRMFNVLWKGKGGMLWRELIPCLNNNMVGGVCPDILVIHLGENDLCATKGVVLLRAMKRDLGLIKERWAGCHVFWTELIPRRIWRGAVNPRAVDRARKKVNLEVSRCCRGLGFKKLHQVIDTYNKECGAIMEASEPVIKATFIPTFSFGTDAFLGEFGSYLNQGQGKEFQLLFHTPQNTSLSQIRVEFGLINQVLVQNGSILKYISLLRLSCQAALCYLLRKEIQIDLLTKINSWAQTFVLALDDLKAKEL
ncbi:uncharacterized protein LOC144820172 [Lissotriton helveticus]